MEGGGTGRGGWGRSERCRVFDVAWSGYSGEGTVWCACVWEGVRAAMQEVDMRHGTGMAAWSARGAGGDTDNDFVLIVRLQMDDGSTDGRAVSDGRAMCAARTRAAPTRRANKGGRTQGKLLGKCSVWWMWMWMWMWLWWW